MAKKDGTHIRKCGGKTVLVLSELLHPGGTGKTLTCQCGAVWHVTTVPNVFKNGVPQPQSVLFYVGNNVAVECC